MLIYMSREQSVNDACGVSRFGGPRNHLEGGCYIITSAHALHSVVRAHALHTARRAYRAHALHSVVPPVRGTPAV